MDNGHEIQGLNEEWTFLGAKLGEWISGVVTFIMVQEIFVKKVSQAMPFLMMVLFGTTMGLKTLRQRFPDEERGIMNFVMVSLGIPPPKIPTPAALQPEWSGAPLRDVRETAEYKELGLDQMFDYIDQDKASQEQE